MGKGYKHACGIREFFGIDHLFFTVKIITNQEKENIPKQLSPPQVLQHLDELLDFSISQNKKSFAGLNLEVIDILQNINSLC